MGVQAPLDPFPVSDSPGPPDGRSFRSGPGLGNCSERPRAGSPPEQPGLSPLAPSAPLPASGVPGAPGRATRSCSGSFPGAARSNLSGPRKTPPPPPGGSRDRLPSPRAPSRGSPVADSLPDPQDTPLRRPGLVRPPAAPVPPRAPRRESRARPLPPDAWPARGTEAAMVTGQRRGAGAWAGRLCCLFLSLPPPLLLLLSLREY